MTITEQTTISQVASSVPSSVRVFQQLGIDFCCGGKRPIGLVCQGRGLSFPDVLARLEDARQATAPDSRDWAKESLTALTKHIVTAYHEPLREELPRLEGMAAKVASVHGAGAPYLSRVKTIVLELSAELRSHMQKEEIVLFPAIEALEDQSEGVMPLSAPITVMEDEHDHAGGRRPGRPGPDRHPRA
jgi:regulator of cell morphogenesis and NO signaling